MKVWLWLSLGLTASSHAYADSASREAMNEESSDEVFDMSLSDILDIGFRVSLIKARENKKNAPGVLDSIVAKDIADFPDLNLAESIQRMPGVAITREGGEGRQISLRGIGSEFTQVQINGMEVLTTSSSPMDSRDAVFRQRRFDFNIFASDMFERIDIYKSYSAHLDEGGIGGSVVLNTPKPFSDDDNEESFRAVLSGDIGTNQNSDETSPRITALVSNTWDDTLGVLASFAYSQRGTEEQGHNTFRWRQRTTSNYAPTIDATTAQQLENGDIWFARGNRLSVWENDQERIGFNTTVQYRPQDDISLEFSLLYGELNNERNEYHTSTTGSSSTALGRVEELRTVNTNGDIEAVFGRFSEIDLRTESRYDIADTDFTQFVLSGDWRMDEQWTLSALVGTAESNFDQPAFDKAYFRTQDPQSITIDYTQDRFLGVNSYPEGVLTNPALWEVRDLDFREFYIENKFTNIKFDLDYAIDESSKLEFGLALKTYENFGLEFRDENYLRDNGTRPTPLNNNNRDISSLYFVYDRHNSQSWLANDVPSTTAYFGLEPDLARQVLPRVAGGRSVDYDIEEETLSFYTQYSWDAMVRGYVGLRYYATDVTLGGRLTGVQERANLSGDYSGVLPTLNLSYDVSEEVMLRFNVSKNITRPLLSDLSAAASVDTADLEITVDDPSLEPFESNNYELNIEWYFDQVGYMAAGFFYKEIKNFAVRQDVPNQTYASTGLPLSLLAAGQTGATVFTVNRPVNDSETTDIKGLELSFQRDFDFLPEPFDKLGIVMNYTIVRGEAIYDNVQGTGLTEVKSFLGLSESSGNYSLYFEQDNWGMRLSSAFRDNYISRVEAGLTDEDERGFHDTTYVDFSAFYALSKQLKISFEGINLTDEREEQYSDSSDRPYNTTTAGETFYLGVAYNL